MASIRFPDVVEASKRLDGVVLRTPVVNSEEIDEMAVRKVFL